MAHNENYDVNQRNDTRNYHHQGHLHFGGKDFRYSGELTKNGHASKKPISEFNNRLNAELMNGNGQGQLRGNGQRKPKQYNNRVYKPAPKDMKPKANESPFVVHINSNDVDLCKANLARLYHMQQSTMQNQKLQRHLDMIAKGTDFYLCRQQMNVIQFHQDLRRYQESIAMSSKVDA